MPHPGQWHWNGFSSLCDRMCPKFLRLSVQITQRLEKNNKPFKLKLLVNVLPHPGTGQTNVASCFLRLWLAFAVRPVVTFGFDTTIGTAVPPPPPPELSTPLSPLSPALLIPCRPDSATSGRSSYRGRGLALGLGYGLGRTDEPPLHDATALAPRSLRVPDEARRK